MSMGVDEEGRTGDG